MSVSSGAALLVDVQRRLTLLAEALSGRVALIAPVEQLDQHYRTDTFASDGKHYWLPTVIDHATDFETNYALYRVALIHQIGYQLHGTFDFSLERFRQLFPDGSEASTGSRAQQNVRSRTVPLDLERLFAMNRQPALLRKLFALIEGWRIDQINYQLFPGLRRDMDSVMSQALAARPALTTISGAPATLEALIRITLQPLSTAPSHAEKQVAHHWLPGVVLPIRRRDASAYDTAAAAEFICGRLTAQGGLPALAKHLTEPAVAPGASQIPVPSGQSAAVSPVQYRGDAFALPALASRRRRSADALATSGIGGAKEHRDEAGQSASKTSTPAIHTEANPSTRSGERQVLIDEWDYLNQQTLRGWCCLKEYRLEGNPGSFRTDLLKRYRDSFERIKRQFNTLRPEAIRLERGLPDGENIELDRAIERFADRRAGLSGDERLYQRRERAERDVAAAFLIDMSASTDFQVADPTESGASEAPADQPALDDIGWSPYDALQLDIPAGNVRRRVIDIARESLGLITAVLQDLGDRFALYGYSGQGRHKVSFGIAKEFNEPCTSQTWGALAAIEPQGSSRMGAAIRHTATRLAKVIAGMKVMIIISDGYPQDIDYGPDRTSDEYGLQDTARAIQEVGHMGIQVFCLSVDPGGHDYLRRVCAPDHYLVIDEVNTLPVELLKVYRGMTVR